MNAIEIIGAYDKPTATVAIIPPERAGLPRSATMPTVAGLGAFADRCRQDAARLHAQLHCGVPAATVDRLLCHLLVERAAYVRLTRPAEADAIDAIVADIRASLPEWREARRQSDAVLAAEAPDA